MYFEPEELLNEFFQLYARRWAFTCPRRTKIEKFRQGAIEHVKELAEALEKGTYRPNYQGVLINRTRPDGTVKSRGITPLRPCDWVVQRVVLKKLQTSYSNSIAWPSSYGRLRANGEEPRSALACCSEIGKRRDKEPWAYKADLVDFYPSIDRRQLLRTFEDLLSSDSKLLQLLTIIIDTDSKPDTTATQEQRKAFWPSGRGVHQGSVLAPFFANVAMGPWDEKSGEMASVFRYVDDWLVMAASEGELYEIRKALDDALPAGVSSHEPDSPKSKVYSAEKEIDFLGLVINEDGRVRPGQHAFAKHDQILKGMASHYTDIVTLTVKASGFNEAWKAYYGPAGLVRGKMNEADKRLKQCIRQWLSNNAGTDRGPIHGEISKLVLRYRPANRSKVLALLNEVESEGDIFPPDVSEVIERLLR